MGVGPVPGVGVLWGELGQLGILQQELWGS